MKKHIILFLSSLLSLIAYSQTVIENPQTGLTSAMGVNITKVELSDTVTILSFRTILKAGSKILIPSKTYIKDISGDEKLYIKRTEGIPFNELYTIPASGEIDYKLVFPAIPQNASYIDYGEGNDGGSWFIYDIAIEPSANKLRLPKELYGDWFSNATGNWELSFQNKYIVYKNKIWSYEASQKAKKIKLIGSDGASVVLHFKIKKSGIGMFGESSSELSPYSKDSKEAEREATIDNKVYELPIFKTDSTTYSGYIKGYTPRVGVKTLSISIDDIIAENQKCYVIDIAPNGFFSIKLPLYYPHLCWIRSTLYNGSVFLEPGKEIFQMIDPSDYERPALFMGESARINSDLSRLRNIPALGYREMPNNILNMSPAQYKAYWQKSEIESMNELDSIMKTEKISAKAYQVMRISIRYSTLAKMMDYEFAFQNAYRKKNNIPRSQKDVSVKIDSLTANYFDFINSESVNNPLAAITADYSQFMNRLKFLKILQKNDRLSIDTKGLINELKKSGYVFTEAEKLMIGQLEKIDSLQNSPEQKEYIEKYSKQESAFYTKYQEDFKEIYQNNPKVDFSIIEKYFKEKKIEFTPEEKELWKAMKIRDESDTVKKLQQLCLSCSNATSAFHTKHRLFIEDFFLRKSNEVRSKSLKELFNIQSGFGYDLLLVQGSCNKIVENLLPLSDERLKAIQQQITTPFISQYIAYCNQQSIAKIKANKEKTGSVINEVPKSKADKVFDNLIKKYAGKVVYVDFWATWCSPCRQGIEEIKPLKEELAGQNVVFVYITNPSSPEEVWKNLIPGIKGEHYRVSNDEWNYLKAKFNISGIPHYVLVGKNGKVIDPAIEIFGNQRLQNVLEKYIKE